MADMFLHGESRLSSFTESLSMYNAELHNHRQGIDTILDCSVGISKIILEYRNDETKIQTSHAQQMTSERTKLIAEAVQEESRSTVTVLTAARSDSQVVKALTFVAMFYLPASLVASIFNSNLIQVEDGGADGGFNTTGLRIE
ncbi:hypothetical protein LTS15_010272 [Exophiala xenobiotica]|nr:hypothetical protein LTS15_010272 [Exophiala xenobiotica]